MLLATINLAV